MVRRTGAPASAGRRAGNALKMHVLPTRELIFSRGAGFAAAAALYLRPLFPPRGLRAARLPSRLPVSPPLLPPPSRASKVDDDDDSKMCCGSEAG